MTEPQLVNIDIHAIPIAVALVGKDGQIDAANDRLVELLGHDPTGQPLLALVTEDDHVDLSNLFEHAGDVGQIELHLSSRPSMRVDVAVATTESGLRLAFLEANADDNQLVDIANQAFDLLGHGIVIGDGTRILSATSNAARLFGRSVEELLGIGSLFSLFEPSEQQRFSTIVADCARSGDPMPERFRTALVQPDGKVWPVDLWIKATVRFGRTRTYTVIADATESAMLEEELAQQATHDQLTGLPNRYLLLDRLESVLRRLQRSTSVDGDAALYFIDLDDFKLVNDRFGHAAGDHVLRIVAERLLDTIRATDTAARLGGDEFVVLSEPDGRGEYEQLRHRLDAALRQPIIHDGVELRTSASIGLCRFSDRTADAGSILALADRDMYDIKSANSAR